MDNSSASISSTQVLFQVHTKHKTFSLIEISIRITLGVVQEPERGSWANIKTVSKRDFEILTADCCSLSPVFHLPWNVSIQSDRKDTCENCAKVEVNDVPPFPIVCKANNITEGSKLCQTAWPWYICSGWSKSLPCSSCALVWLFLVTEARGNNLQFPGCSFLPLLNQLHWDIFHFSHNKLILLLHGNSLMLIYILKRPCLTGFSFSMC